MRIAEKSSSISRGRTYGAGAYSVQRGSGSKDGARGAKKTCIESSDSCFSTEHHYSRSGTSSSTRIGGFRESCSESKPNGIPDDPEHHRSVATGISICARSVRLRHGSPCPRLSTQRPTGATSAPARCSVSAAWCRLVCPSSLGGLLCHL